MKTPTIFTFLTLLCAGGVQAEVIGFKFLDTDDTPLNPAVTAGAGAYAQSNWNLLRRDWSGTAENDALFTDGIKNSSGATTTSLLNVVYGANEDPVHFDSANTWRSGAGNADANATLMNGYLDDGLDDQPYVNFSLDAGSFADYTVVVYFNGDGQNGPVGRYWLEEWTDPLAPGTVITDQVGVSNNSYTGTFVQAGSDFPQTATPTNVDVATGNYIVFTGLTARNIRVRAAGNIDPEDFGRGPLNAVQILDTVLDPEGDADNDGLSNGWEALYGLDPNSNVGDQGANGDPDNDNLTNLQELGAGTSPVDSDSDNDGLLDGVETGGGTWNGPTDTGTNPLVDDSDADGLLDGVEDNTGSYVDENATGSNPNVFDTDSDGLPDGWEVAANIDPNDDGTTNVQNGPAGDPDNDSSDNAEELARGTDPADEDSDDDTLLDGYEDLGGTYVSATQTGTDPLNADSDFDTISDGAETADGNFVDANQTGTDPNVHDSDGDGYFDEQELAAGTNPTDVNNKPSFPVPIGFWTFDDQGETSTADLSPNGYTGTVAGAATYVTGHTGLPGDYAINLDGVDDAVTTQLSLSNIGYFTMAGWIKSSVIQTNRSGLFGQNDILEFGFSTGDTVHLWSNPGGAIETFATPTEWTHIAFVGDGTGRTIFINGVEVVRGAAATPLNASDFFFNIGGGGVFDDVAVNGNYFEGQMDDVAVWDVSMSPQLIAALANGSVTPLPLANNKLEITAISLTTDNRVNMTVSGTVPGVSYSVQESTNLVDWREVNDFTGAAGETVTEVVTILGSPVAPKKFYYVAPVN